MQICKKGVGALEQAGHEGVGNHDEPAALSLNGEKEDGGEGDLWGEMFASVIFPAEMNVDKDNGDIDGGDSDERRKNKAKKCPNRKPIRRGVAYASGLLSGNFIENGFGQTPVLSNGQARPSWHPKQVVVHQT